MGRQLKYNTISLNQMQVIKKPTYTSLYKVYSDCYSSSTQEYYSYAIVASLVGSKTPTLEETIFTHIQISNCIIK